MTNIVKFPYRSKPKTNPFYRWVMPARIIAITIAVSITIGILTAIVGPAAFLIMAIAFMIWTMVYLP